MFCNIQLHKQPSINFWYSKAIVFASEDQTHWTITIIQLFQKIAQDNIPKTPTQYAQHPLQAFYLPMHQLGGDIQASYLVRKIKEWCVQKLDGSRYQKAIL